MSCYLFESKCRHCCSGYLRKAFTPSDELKEGHLHNHSTNSEDTLPPLCVGTGSAFFTIAVVTSYILIFSSMSFLLTFVNCPRLFKINSIIALFSTWVAWMYNTVPVLNLKSFGQGLEVSRHKHHFLRDHILIPLWYRREACKTPVLLPSRKFALHHLQTLKGFSVQVHSWNSSLNCSISLAYCL